MDFFEAQQFKAIAAGTRHTLVLDEKGRLFGFGNNELYQLTDQQPVTNIDTPSQITVDGEIASIYAGYEVSTVFVNP